MSGDKDIVSLETHVEVRLTGDIDPRRLLTIARQITRHDGWDTQQALLVDARACNFHRSLNDLDIAERDVDLPGSGQARTVWVCQSDFRGRAAQILEMLLSRSGLSRVSFAETRQAGRSVFSAPLDA